MNPILSLIRSKTYKNFWKFIAVGALISGALVTLSSFISRFFEKPEFEIQIIFFNGFYGMGFGCIAAFLGFWIMYFLGRGRSLKTFSVLSVVVALVLATLVIVAFYGTWSIPLYYQSIIFPGIPYFGSIYFFRKFAVRYIYPLN